MGRLLLSQCLILLWAVAMATAMIAKCECGATLWQPPSKRGYTWKPLLATSGCLTVSLINIGLDP